MALNDTLDAPDAEDEGDSALLRKFQKWFDKDREHSEDWRTQAKEDYDFVAGEQWDPKDRAFLEENKRPVITFNRIDPLIRSVSGEQINNAQEVRYIPREMGDVKANELLTSAAEWFRDQCDADDEESDAFWDTAIAGMGWTDTRLDMDNDPDEPMPVIERIEPQEMFWDADSRKRNLSDSRRLWRVRDMPMDAAQAMFPDASPSDLDASWARLDSDGKPHDATASTFYEDKGVTGREDSLVTIVQCQWWEREAYYKVALPQGVAPSDGQPARGAVELSVEEYNSLKPKLDMLGEVQGAPVQAVKLERRVYKQAFIGRTILKQGNTPCPDHFSFNCITGFRDRNKGTFYGLVRAMKDPQRWANKWLSQTLHIMNSTAKGGIMMEAGAAENQRQFEESFAKSDQISWVRDGALQGTRIQPKPVGSFPAGFFQLMTFAISSVRDVAGINLEMLGMREADQPASLEYQRRQAGVTILAQLFRSMRRYHRNQGKVLLYYIQHYLADGRLVKIVGDEGAQYVPLMKQADVKYDIVVDEGPTSPNQKERVWGLIGQNFWGLPPDIQMALLDYSPFPESVISKVKQAAQQASQNPQAQMSQKLGELEAALKQVQVQLTQAQAQKVAAEAQHIGKPAESMNFKDLSPEAQAQMLLQAGIQVDPAVLAQRAAQGSQDQTAALDAAHQANQLAAHVQLKRESNAADIALERQKQAGDMAMQNRKMMLDAVQKHHDTAASLQANREKAAADAKAKVMSAALGAMFKPPPEKPAQGNGA